MNGRAVGEVAAAHAPTLDALRLQGMDRLEPVRFHYLQALQRRMAAQPPAVQRLLQPHWQEALRALQAGRAGPAAVSARVPASCAAAPGEAPGAVPAATPCATRALATLNAELRERTRAEVERSDQGESTSMSELKSVRGFGEVWSKIAIDQQVEQSLQRGPENAGPLNPHRLVLRSLGLMRSLSPAYLRCFMAQVDALLWLEHSQGAGRPAAAARAAVGSARPARAATTAKVAGTGRSTARARR